MPEPLLALALAVLRCFEKGLTVAARPWPIAVWAVISDTNVMAELLAYADLQVWILLQLPCSDLIAVASCNASDIAVLAGRCGDKITLNNLVWSLAFQFIAACLPL